MIYTIWLGNGRSERFEIPTSDIPAVKALGPKLDEGQRVYREAERRVREAREAQERFGDKAKAAAREAALAGQSVPSKGLVKRKRQIDDALDEALLEHEAASAIMWRLRGEAIDTLMLQGPALKAEASAALDADILKVATLHAKARELEAVMSTHIGTLGLVARLNRGDSARSRPDGEGAAAMAQLGTAIENLAGAATHATRLLEGARRKAHEPIDEVDDDEDDDE